MWLVSKHMGPADKGTARLWRRVPHPRRPSVLLTVPQPRGLQHPEQLTADVLAVPARFSQALGHCEVRGVQIRAGVRVRSRS